MSDPDPGAAKQWQQALAIYATNIVRNMRIFGIEMTPDEARDIVLEELKAAVRQNLRELFLLKIQGKM